MRKFATEGAWLAAILVYAVSLWVLLGIVGDWFPSFGIHRITLPTFAGNQPSNLIPSFTTAPALFYRVALFLWLCINVLVASAVINRNWIPAAIGSLFSFFLGAVQLFTYSSSDGFLHGQFFPIATGVLLLVVGALLACFAIVECASRIRNG